MFGIATGGGGFSGSSSSTSRSGDASVGSFNFAPAPKVHPLVWAAIGVLALVVLVKVVR